MMSKNLDQNTPADYKIIVKGMISGDWSAWFGDMQITHMENNNGVHETHLTGRVIDQADLQGILAKLQDLGLPIIAINLLEDQGINKILTGNII